MLNSFQHPCDDLGQAAERLRHEYNMMLKRVQHDGGGSYSAASAISWNSAAARNFSASSAAMQPVPAAVTAWR